MRSPGKMAKSTKPAAGHEVTAPVPGKVMSANNAGGYGFQTSIWKQLDRFLIIGSEGGTFYLDEKKLTIDSAQNVLRCIEQNGPAVLNTTVEISESGRALSNMPAVFVLALIAEYGDKDLKCAAYAALPRVCRIGTDLFGFAAAKKELGGAFGSGCRRALARWYTDKTPDQLAYQLVKYRQRLGWSHKDVLAMARPAKANDIHGAMFRWVTQGKDSLAKAVSKGGEKDKPETARRYPAIEINLPRMLTAFDELQGMCASAATSEAVAAFVVEHKLPWETIPTEYLDKAVVWDALLHNSLPMNAMVRSLVRMTKAGLLTSNAQAIKTVVSKLGDVELIHKSKIHPMSFLKALKAYGGAEGSQRSILDALDAAFYTAFKNVTPTGKRFLLGLDISGSMSCGTVIGMTNITPREATAAIALVTAATEPNYAIAGFSNTCIPLDISPSMKLADVIKKISSLPFGGTNMGSLFEYADKNKMKVDVFSVYTDNEVNAGSHIHSALADYRKKHDIQSKAVFCATTATNVSVADPNDPLMLDMVGFDSDTPAAISAFANL